MRDHGIGHIVGTVLAAPENTATVNELKECARRAGFKAGYNECLTHVNPFYQSKFTDERSGFHGIDTEAFMSLLLTRTITCPFPPSKILRNVWRRKITWTVCGCCMNDLRRRKPLVVQRKMRAPVAQKKTRLACVPFFTSFLM
ncbi:hypothetical protein Hdeb2414_s0010g00332491 [Helianthus debilis subsp. tardiflorus]